MVLSATVHGREDAVREVLRSQPAGLRRANRGALAYADAIVAGRGGQADLAEQHLQEGDRLLAPLPWWHRMLRVTTFQSAIADGWGSPVGPLRGDLAAFERDGDQQWVRLCRDLLRRAGAPTRRGRGDSVVPAELRAVGVTSRELDVLVPLASGRGNAAIAEQLFLSPRTVETHVASLLLKAGLTNRAELGEWYRGLTPVVVTDPWPGSLDAQWCSNLDQGVSMTIPNPAYLDQNEPTSPTAWEVIVVGAGPSGLTTAAALARAGIRVLVIEKHPGLSTFPKATGLRPRTMEILRSWGLESTILAQSQPTQLAMSISPVLAAPGTAVSMGLPTAADLAEVSPSQIAVCPQDRLEAILLEHLLERGGHAWLSTELVALEQDDSVVRVTVCRGGREQTLTCRHLVGADGARSAVRGLLGVELEELGSEGDHLGVLFRGDLSAVVPPVPYALSMVVAPPVAGIFVPTGEPDRWIYDIEWSPAEGETLADWPTERMAARITAAVGLEGLQPQIIGMFPWDFGASVAARQHCGRVFLVGDAAHRTTPRGATGMNTGIADAHNLAWKLVWVLRGWAGDELLDSYQSERGPVGLANARASLQTRIGQDGTSALAHDFGVTYRSAVVLTEGRWSGQRAPHAWVRVNGERRSTIDLFEGHLTLVLGPDAASWRGPANTVGRAGIPLVLRQVGRDLLDPDGSFEAAYGLGGHGCVLVRPDGFVVWSAERGSSVDLLDAVAVATGRAGVVCGSIEQVCDTSLA